MNIRERPNEMSKKRFFLVLIVASISAFLGSFVSSQLYWLKNTASNEKVKQQRILPSDHGIHPDFKVLEANEFRLIDPEGNSLAKLTIEEERHPYLDELLRRSNTSKTFKTYYAVLEMGSEPTTMRISRDGLKLKTGSTQAILASGNLTIMDKSAVRIYADSILLGGTAIEILDDKKKPRAVLGSVDLNMITTGEIQKRPESSLVLFGNDGKVVYSAP
jgi:hypothetical protein